MVSILIAARNEETNIIACLQSVSNLSYPAGEFEVLIGNDASEDQTSSLIEKYIQDKPNFRLFHIYKDIGMARGKANVLAQLVHQAKGEYLFITDADIQLPSTWISNMLLACGQHTGVVAGMTIVKGKRLFHHLQSLDWSYAFGMVHLLMERQIPITAMGNNMVVTRQAYQATGGYENIPFSITEDYALFHEIVRRGFGFKHLLNKHILAYSQPVSGFMDLLRQRKRWMAGAIKLPFYVQCLFLLQALIFPAALVFLLIAPEISLLILLLKLSMDTAFLCWVLSRIKELHLIRYVLLYEIYVIIFSLATFLYYFKPGKLQWKGREYEPA